MKFKKNDIVEITMASGYVDSRNGDKATIYDDSDYLNGAMAILHKNGKTLHLGTYQAKVISRALVNKDFLKDFVKLNKINVSRVSVALGHTRSWLATMYSKSKYDISDETLKSILKKLHIDWASKEFLYVDAEVPYRTKPCNYKLDKHKEELQKLFWMGKVTA